jgi:ureidoacrylate peracid hydrolase
MEEHLKTSFLKTLKEKVAPANAALIVVDVQNEFCADDGVFGKTGNNLSMVQSMVPRLERLIDRARKVGVPVIFTQSIYDPIHLAPVWHERNARLNFDVPRCITGSKGADFYRVKPLPEEVVVQKHRFSAFIGTQFDLILRARDIRTLIMTGVATDICVGATAREAFMRNYYVVFVDDASATYKKEHHDATLDNIALGFGVVTKAEEILDAWRDSDITKGRSYARS